MKHRYYFSHDYNARNDPKLARVLMDIGVAGIGAYWCIVEMLYEEEGYLSLEDLPTIARQLRMQQRTLEKLVKNYKLFEVSEGVFTSFAVLSRISERLSKSDAARKSALSRWEKDANAMRTQCERNTINKRKEDKRKEKEKKSFAPHDAGLNQDSDKYFKGRYGHLVQGNGKGGSTDGTTEADPEEECQGIQRKSEGESEAQHETLESEANTC